MKLSAYASEEGFEILRPEWNELLERSTSDRVFSTWEWLSTWWSAYQPGELWIIACRDDGGRLIGLAPWFIENHPVFKRVVRSIGCVEVTDYLDLIVDTEHIEVVLEALAGYAAEHQSKYDIIDLCNLPENSPGHALFPGALSRHGFTATVVQQEVCPVIPLPLDWEGYLELLDKKQRHEVRRKLRRAEGAAEKVDWYIVGKDHDLQEEIECFLQLMAASQAGKATFLEDAQNVRFFKSVVPMTYERGWLQMSFLTVNGERTAAYLNFVYKGRVLVYNSGLLPDHFAHLSPGIVLLAYTIQHAIETGQQVFDFLRGDEVYKYRMGGQDTRVYKLRAEKA